ncbi:MAG: hypothetical protein VYE68_08400 [Acidobacteriota bacterium]|nr:hypothetical protein [Acidobacteriota bacterium]
MTQRTREIGLRMEPGVEVTQTVRLVVGDSFLLVASCVEATVTLVRVGLAASLVPARRATRVDPMIALRASQPFPLGH